MKKAPSLRPDRHIDLPAAISSFSLSRLPGFWLAVILLLQLTAVGAAAAAERPVVREVITTPEGNGARIEIRADQQLTYRSYLMPELAKWVIDLPGAKTTYFEDESRQMRTPPLERITVRQKEVNGDQFTRIGLDFKGEVDFSIKADPLDKGRLVVLLTPSKATLQKLHTAPSAAAPPQPSGTAVSKPAEPIPIPQVKATAVTNIRITTDVIRIEADGTLRLPTPIILTRPGRLVLDVTGVSSAVQSIPVPAANRFGIVRGRLGKNTAKLRIVFEVKGEIFPDFQLQETVNGVEIRPTATGK